MDTPINNPEIPFTGYINGGMRPGRLVRVQGRTNPSTESFVINLLCGQNGHTDDVPLRLSVRFNENAIVRNSRSYNNWGAEERHGSHFALQKGQQFEILVLCEPNQYKIAVNGEHYTEFMTRIPCDRISHINVEGDVSISLIQFDSIPNYIPSGQSNDGVIMSPTAPPPPETITASTTTPLSAPPPYGNAPYGNSPYPPSTGGLPPMGGFVQPPMGGPGGHYPPAGGPGYPNPGGYPPQQNPYPSAGQAYPSNPYGGQQPYPQQQPYPGGAYPQQPGYPGGAGYPGQQPGYPQQGHQSGGSGIMGTAGKVLAGVGLAGLAGKMLPGVMGGGHGSHGTHGGYYPGHGGGGHSGSGLGPLGGLAAGAGALGIGGLVANKAMKKHKKGKKNKLLKYGLPLAGVGVGGYALKKGMKGFGGRSSSSSSSSSSEEE